MNEQHSSQDVFSNEEFTDDEPKIPWHFWIGVALVALYLFYRLIQGLIFVYKSIF